MPLMIFDIDGTLTQTVGVDDSAFVAAFDDALGLRGFDADWANYPHATDNALVTEIVRRARGTPPTADEAGAIQSRFLDRLRAVAAVTGRIVPTPGAAQLLSMIRERTGVPAEQGWGLALASGGWRESAMIKLTAAGLLTIGIPGAFADDALARDDLARLAIARSVPYRWSPGDDPSELMTVAREMFGGIVLIGDGVWDARTARALCLGFVGIAPPEKHARLRAEGARTLITSFAPARSALATLIAEAEEPTWR
ncbi:MAG: HAD family hydrolase [Phycisphaerales bacterium]